MSVQTPIRGLRSFCVAAKCLSFKHAANQLYLTPSAVSHQIKQLEEQLGTELFIRGTRSITLSAMGKQFYQSVAPIIHELESTISEFTQRTSNKTIVIALPEFFASELFIPKLKQWSAQYPDINLQLEMMSVGEQASPLADLSIVLSSSQPNASVVEELFPMRYVPACNQQVAQEFKQSSQSLNQFPLILHRSRPWAWHQWADAATIEGFDPKQIIQLDSMYGIARAAQQGMGVALIPLPISQAWFDNKSLVPLFDCALDTKDRYFLIQHENLNNRPELTLISEWVVENFTTSSIDEII
ncbi:MAG: LysR family transcriptional regulator [Psychrobium sp.]